MGAPTRHSLATVASTEPPRRSATLSDHASRPLSRARRVRGPPYGPTTLSHLHHVRKHWRSSLPGWPATRFNTAATRACRTGAWWTWFDVFQGGEHLRAVRVRVDKEMQFFAGHHYLKLDDPWTVPEAYPFKRGVYLFVTRRLEDALKAGAFESEEGLDFYTIDLSGSEDDTVALLADMMLGEQGVLVPGPRQREPVLHGGVRSRRDGHPHCHEHRTPRGSDFPPIVRSLHAPRHGLHLLTLPASAGAGNKGDGRP